ncbi:helix-turn-helix domain-containing protein [Rhizobium sp. BG4]|uniref:MerR family transcriptional regulator n=1 Tax=Rhizobium sp. BG4 TaxID=2613770 RepID=UPI00193DF96C|nr:helix-turn-helix domain-containing protein [Rhizobium sp. BG4]QRM44634.1 helix-turn-helix domain-containing protein [Rhizobium sp. BG4]
MLTIGDLSRRTGVKIPTIRYYEEMGLLSHAERSEGNQRRYTKQERERLSFIRHARELGMTIEAIRDLLEMSRHPDMPCSEVDRIALGQLATVKQKIERLRKLEVELERIASHRHEGAIRDCYVIQALANLNLPDDTGDDRQ